MSTIERSLSCIEKRSWLDVKNRWSDERLEFGEGGLAPEEDLTALAPLTDLCVTLKKTDAEWIEDVVPGLRPAVFHHSLYSLHRAAHTLNAAAVHLEEGLSSWSIASAHQSNLFAMSAIAGFLGIATIDGHSKQFMIDIWAYPQKKSKKSRPGDAVLIKGLPSLNHVDRWSIFQGVLKRTFDFDEIRASSWLTYLLKQNATDLVRSRNMLCYRFDGWPLLDLHALHSDLRFRKAKDDLDCEDPFFEVHASFHLTCAAVRMLTSLTAVAPRLNAELQLARSLFSGALGTIRALPAAVAI